MTLRSVHPLMACGLVKTLRAMVVSTERVRRLSQSVAIAAFGLAQNVAKTRSSEDRCLALAALSIGRPGAFWVAKGAFLRAHPLRADKNFGASTDHDRSRRFVRAATEFVLWDDLTVSRHRTPTVTLMTRDTFGKNPARARQRAGEPQPSQAIGPAPATLSVEHRACFDEIVQRSHIGVLSSADSIAVEMAAALLAAFRRDPENLSAAKFARLEALLGRFGMTPADRSKVTVAPLSDTSNPAARFFSSMRDLDA